MHNRRLNWPIRQPALQGQQGDEAGEAWVFDWLQHATNLGFGGKAQILP